MRSPLPGPFLSLALLFALVGTLAPVLAQAQVQLRFEGRTQRMDFTGPAQASNEVNVVRVMPRRGRISNAPAGLTRIRIVEKSDEPCALRATFEQLVPPVRDTPAPRGMVVIDLPNTSSGCDADDNSGRIELKAADVAPAGRFLSSVGTCTNNRSNDRGLLVKGLAGTAFGINTDGTTTGVAALSPDEQPSCEESNYTYSQCPNRQVAIGLDVKLKVIGGRQSITGLRLRCRAFGPVPEGQFELRRSDDPPRVMTLP